MVEKAEGGGSGDSIGRTEMVVVYWRVVVRWYLGGGGMVEEAKCDSGSGGM